MKEFSEKQKNWNRETYKTSRKETRNSTAVDVCSSRENGGRRWGIGKFGRMAEPVGSESVVIRFNW